MVLTMKQFLASVLYVLIVSLKKWPLTWLIYKFSISTWEKFRNGERVGKGGSQHKIKEKLQGNEQNALWRWNRVGSYSTALILPYPSSVTSLFKGIDERKLNVVLNMTKTLYLTASACYYSPPFHVPPLLLHNCEAWGKAIR